MSAPELHPLSPRLLLPEGARLRRDRGTGLYVADAFIRSPYFTCQPMPGGWRLSPAPALLLWAESLDFKPPGAFARSLCRFRGLAAEEASLLLFAEGAKLLEAPEEGRLAAWERALRRRAAECMRLNGKTGASAPPTGGGLYACAKLAEAAQTIKNRGFLMTINDKEELP